MTGFLIYLALAVVCTFLRINCKPEPWRKAMKPCLNCGKNWDCRNCHNCGLNLAMWMRSGNAGRWPAELEMEQFLENEYAAKDAARA